MEFISKSEAETEKFGSDIALKLRGEGQVPGHTGAKSAIAPQAAKVVALYGDLGSGKTTFTKSFVSHFGVKETVTSPTFVIEKVYELPSGTKTWKHIIHIDAYRIEKSDELIKLGWRDITADPENLIIIEWPEKIQDILPADALKIKFEFVDETMRKITL